MHQLPLPSETLIAFRIKNMVLAFNYILQWRGLTLWCEEGASADILLRPRARADVFFIIREDFKVA